MKNLNNYITEKLKLNKDTKPDYKFHPENKEELQKILKELLIKGETNLNSIDVSKITDMNALFYDLHLPDGYIKTIDISEWDVSNVKTMNRMFMNYELFNADLSSWDVSNVTSMWGMFYKCKRFTGKGLEKWNVRKVTNMYDVFKGCKRLRKKPSWYHE